VLSVGIEPTTATSALAEKLGITLEDTGFLRSANDALDTVGTVRPGIYIAGTAVAPKDIPDSVISGGSAAMRAFADTRKPSARARSK
jgi:heterodisulfide reductase subunit A